MYYSSDQFTWGYEIEFGDIDRTLPIPEHLGAWEYAETDIVNLQEPYKYVACDPLGTQPPMGGEINTKPTRTISDQVFRIITLRDYFMSHGNRPTTGCVNHGHLHVYVPGLREDIGALKRLIAYIMDNQQDTIEACYQFQPHPEMQHCKGATAYLKFDGGRPMPEYMGNNILNLATDFDSFIKLHAAGKDGVSMGRPFRYAINTYCMKHTGTIEFRCFRSSTDYYEIRSQFEFAEQFLDAALNGGQSVKQILAEERYKFPPFVWNKDEYMGWVNTKWDKSRGEKRRQFHAVG